MPPEANASGGIFFSCGRTSGLQRFRFLGYGRSHNALTGLLDARRPTTRQTGCALQCSSVSGLPANYRINPNTALYISAEISLQLYGIDNVPGFVPDSMPGPKHVWRTRARLEQDSRCVSRYVLALDVFHRLKTLDAIVRGTHQRCRAPLLTRRLLTLPATIMRGFQMRGQR